MMARRPFKAQSADGTMLFPALEQHYPADQQIANDPYAIAMLSPGLRLIVRAMRWRWLRDQLARTLEKQTPGLWGGMLARKRYADDAVTDALEAGIRQFVILGAGFDTRAFRLIAPTGAEAFEVDLPGNVARKRNVLRRLFGDTPERVHLVAVDFESDDLAESLAAQGCQPDQPTMFVLEAVTQYLTERAATELFTQLAKAPAGSRLVFTYVDKRFLLGEQMYGWEAAYRKWVVEDRAWTYGLRPEEVGGLLRTHGWAEREQVGAEEYTARYFRPLGRSMPLMAIERFVAATKQ